MTPALPAERVFHTKDAGKTDSDGNMILVGRSDEMFKVSGYRIEPAEVEKAGKSASGLKHMVVRRFGPSTPFGRVWKELLLMQKSYENGTSAAKAYGIVHFESDYGILMDRNKS